MIETLYLLHLASILSATSFTILFYYDSITLNGKREIQKSSQKICIGQSIVHLVFQISSRVTLTDIKKNKSQRTVFTWQAKYNDFVKEEARCAAR